MSYNLAQRHLILMEALQALDHNMQLRAFLV